MDKFIWTGLEAVQHRIERVAPLDITVLLSGESGTGKTQIAYQIHKLSHRSDKPFRRVACPAIPGDLFESELFGHVRGAFTGAQSDRRGEVESAEGGTLFLEEVGDLSLQNQAKLLAFLDDRKFRRIGDSMVMEANVRILSATHRNLQTDIRDGRFLAPLYFRLREFEIEVPSLDRRRAGIPDLVLAFVSGNHSRFGHGGIPEIEPAALQALKNARFVGNIRDLESLLGTAMVLTPVGSTITRQTMLQAGLPITEGQATTGGHAVAGEDVDELDSQVRKIADSLPGFVSAAGDRCFAEAVLAQGRYLISEMAKKSSNKGQSSDTSRALLDGVSMTAETIGFKGAIYALAIAIRWDLATNCPEIDQIRVVTLSRRYSSSFSKGQNMGAVYKALRDLLVPSGENFGEWK